MRFSRPILFILAFVGVGLLASTAIIIFKNGGLSSTNNGLSSSGTVKIAVSSNGMYAVTMKDLRELGIDVDGFNYMEMALSTSGIEIPYTILDELLIFYGAAPDNRYSAIRSYRLDIGSAGIQMATSQNSSAYATPIEWITRTLHFEENNVYDSRAVEDLSREEPFIEPWFWQIIRSGDRFTHQFEIGEADPNDASFSVQMSGASSNSEMNPDHHLDVIINDTHIGSMEWDGETVKTAMFDLPGDLLRGGLNELTLDNSNNGAADLDISRLDWLELTYRAPIDLDSNNYEFSTGPGLLALDDLDEEPILMEISDPFNPQLVSELTAGDGRAKLHASSDMKLVLATLNGLETPAGISSWRESDLDSVENQADLIIIAPDNFIEPLKPLTNARNDQGISSIIAPVEEIYDTFDFGNKNPQAISRFIQYASSSWMDPKPRYILLVGDTTYDYKNYLGNNPDANIPSPMVPVKYSGETVSDPRFADIDGDRRPELAIGRWPVNNVEDVEKMVRRTLAYESENVSDRAIFAADGSSPEFSNLNHAVIEGSGFDDSAITHMNGAPAQEVTDSWNDGAWLVSYAGHGSLDRWGKEGVFSSKEVEDLKSIGAPPIVLQLTCLTGFFAHPELPSLSESLLLHEDGPVLVISATSLTLSSSQEPFGREFLNALIDPEVQRIGDALVRAKSVLEIEQNEELREVSDTFTLLGDPSALIRRPENISTP